MRWGFKLPSVKRTSYCIPTFALGQLFWREWDGRKSGTFYRRKREEERVQSGEHHTVVGDDANDDESMMQRYRLPSSSILTTRTDDDHRIIDDDNARVRGDYTRLQRPRPGNNDGVAMGSYP